MREDQYIKVVNAALEERGEDIILRGVIDTASLAKLKVDTYQREFLGGSGRSTSLKAAVAAGEILGDVELGMRGQKHSSRGSTFTLEEEVYIIDGFQRVQTVLEWMKNNPGKDCPVKIGAMIHFDTDRDWERNQFRILNTRRTSVSPNVILRNQREDHASILTLYGISTNNKLSPLYKRVCWEQRMKRGELFTALMLVRTAACIHSQNGATQQSTSSRTKAGPAGLLDGLAERTGLQTFRSNVETFFETIDECFGIKGIVYRDMATQTRTNFLVAVAQMFAMHKNFWKGKELAVSSDDRSKLKTFPISEPTVAKLASAGNAALPLLSRLLIDHMNKGRRDHRLEPRMVPAKEEHVKKLSAA